MSSREIIYAAAGASGPATYIEDVFSTYLYTGNGSSQTITNNIDLSGKGGMVWIKARNEATDGVIFDTNRGISRYMYPTGTATSTLVSGYGVTAFNNNGFAVTGPSGYYVNTDTTTYASWTFRKQPKFFDVVTYTGNGAGNRTISHNLGSTPGMIIVKPISSAGSWWVYHRSLPSKYMLFLNLTLQAVDYSPDTMVGNPTTTTFEVNTALNSSGETYVAYLFAHNAGGFGLSGNDNVISCGSFTTNSGSSYSAFTSAVNLGYEPQWVLIKRVDSTSPWSIMDIMRDGNGYGFNVQSLASAQPASVLQPNSSSSETTASFATPYLYIGPNSTGFTGGISSSPDATYIYMAIRRGPMKTPTTGTSVFQPVRYAGNNASGRVISTGKTFPTDWLLTFDTENGASGTGTAYNSPDITRLTGFGVNPPYLRTNSTAAESAAVNTITLSNSNFDYTVGATSGQLNSTGANYTNWNIGRAPGFFDVVCYTGTGTATNYTHNLGVVPELYIIKRRSAAASWIVGGTVFPSATANYIPLENIALQTQSNTWQTPTATTFGIGTAFQSDNTFNASGSTYIAYLFATLAGVSKVGSYTGTGSTQTINAGLPTGARFVLIKRTDSVGDWWAWDTATGMVAGNDTRIAINLTAQIVNQNWVYTVTNGFQIVTADASVNANGGTYIYLAIA